MIKKYQILIVGGGNAGISVAAKLLIKNKKLQIGIIDPSEKHYYQPAWTLVGAGVYNILNTEKEQKNFIPKGANWIQDSVSDFYPADNKIKCVSGLELTYDILVICPGIQLDWNKIKGLEKFLGKNEISSNYDFHTAPYTWELIQNFKGGTAVFTNPTSPIKCGGAPQKIMYLAVDYWRKKGILDDCKVHFLSGSGGIFGVKEYAESLLTIVKQGNINTHFGVNVVEIDGSNKKIFYEEKNSEGKILKKEMKFDFCHIVPPQSAPDFIKHSELADPNNQFGYIEVDKNTLQHTRYSNVFCLGDSSNAPCSKTGAAIRKQAPVVVDNILSFLDNKNLTAQYDGYSACPIPTNYGKLILAEFDYSNTPKMTFPFDQTKPRWSMWILKTRILPWLYWNRILPGID